MNSQIGIVRSDFCILKRPLHLTHVGIANIVHVQ